MTFENMKTGIISEKQLVKYFGTPAQKKSYSENGRFIGGYKKKFLDKLKRYCEIEDLGDRKYEITRVYEFPFPSNFNKMNSSIYKYIVPLILSMLTKGHDESRKVDITVGKWAREIKMVNKNYNLMKYNQEAVGEEFEYPTEAIAEFYEKSDDMINYYITNALDYLKSAGLIIWRDVYKIVTEESSGTVNLDHKGEVHTEVTLTTKQASQDDMDYYAACIKIADEENNITNASDRYYSKKAKRFQSILSRELYKRGIKNIYKTYEAYYINLDKCKFILDAFQIESMESLIENFNSEFESMIVENAKKRYKKIPSKYSYCKDDEIYSICFSGMCDMTINHKTDYLGERIKPQKAENYKLDAQIKNISEVNDGL